MLFRIIVLTAIAFCFLGLGQVRAQKAAGVTDTLGYYRKQIDTLDKQIIDLLGERMRAARAIGIYKMDHNIGVVQSARFDEVLQNAIRRGKERLLSEDFVKALYNDIHAESVRQQEALQQERKR